MNSSYSRNTSTPNITNYSPKELIKVINLYYPIILSLMVTIGNLISYVVFSTPTFKNNTSCFFIKIKLINDVFNVYVGTWRYVFLGTTGTEVKNISATWCYVMMISVSYIDPSSSWLNVLSSLDRLVIVLKPTVYRSISLKSFRRFQRIIVCCMYLTLALIVFPARVISHKFNVNVKILNNNSTLTTGTCATVNPIADFLNIILTIIAPFVVMIICSLIMGISLIRSKLKINKNHISRKSLTFIETIVCLDVFFLVFNLPKYVLNFMTSKTDWIILGIQLTTVVKYSFNSLSVVFFLSVNSLFRENFFLLFSLLKFNNWTRKYKKGT